MTTPEAPNKSIDLNNEEARLFTDTVLKVYDAFAEAGLSVSKTAFSYDDVYVKPDEETPTGVRYYYEMGQGDRSPDKQFSRDDYMLTMSLYVPDNGDSRLLDGHVQQVYRDEDGVERRNTLPMHRGVFSDPSQRVMNGKMGSKTVPLPSRDVVTEFRNGMAHIAESMLERAMKTDDGNMQKQVKTIVTEFAKSQVLQLDDLSDDAQAALELLYELR